jgi:hypothetical protein
VRKLSIRDLDDADLELRAWCFACARGEVVSSAIWQKFERKGWPIDLIGARPRFRCKQCRSSADVILLPATPRGSGSWAGMVAAFFHSHRSAGKRRR